MNVSATLNAFRLIHNPSLCLPHATISTFNHLPIPISLAFASSLDGQRPDIRAVVLDKDDCFARPRENVVYKPFFVGDFFTPNKQRILEILNNLTTTFFSCAER